MDIHTLTVVNLILLFLYAAIIAINTSLYGKVRGAAWFSWSNLSRGLAWLVLSADAFLPKSLSTVAGDLLLVLGVLLLHRSVAEVMGRGKTAWHLQLVLALLACAGIASSALFFRSYSTTLLVVSLALAIQLALTTALIFSDRRPGFRGAIWFTGTILFSYAL